MEDKKLQNKLKKRPIGVFDSGIGGLTVAKSLFDILPNEDIIYLGDSARLPYGTKSKETIILYSIECLKFLLKKNVKFIVVACNTASANALPFLQKITKVPVIGVITPGAEAAVNKSKSERIGVIATMSTVQTESYKKEIHKKNKGAQVFSKACSLFVQLAEDGWTDNKIAELVAKEYLQEFTKLNIDTLILGCTHYPILKNTIQKVIGKKILLIDSGEETAKQAKIILTQRNLLNTQKKAGEHRFFVTDFQHKFKDVSERFLGRKLNKVQKIKLN